MVTFSKLLVAVLLGQAFQANALAARKWQAAYTNDFSKYDIGDDEPEGLLILEGDFAVGQTDGNKHFRLPEEPLDNFGFLFGPRIPGNLAVQCRFLSERKGRRAPTFSLGLGGVTGFRIKVNPAYRKLQLLKEDAIVAETPFRWESGQWLTLRLQREQLDGKAVPDSTNPKWRISAKAWHGNKEPAKWSLLHDTDARQSAGKCSAWAAPYSTRKIYFDDLAVFSIFSPSLPKE